MSTGTVQMVVDNKELTFFPTHWCQGRHVYLGVEAFDVLAKFLSQDVQRIAELEQKLNDALAGKTYSEQIVESLAARLKAADKFVERFARDYERVPFNMQLWKYVDEYRQKWELVL